MTSIIVTGAKGGQGTTTVALILAAALAQHAPTVVAAAHPAELVALAAGARLEQCAPSPAGHRLAAQLTAALLDGGARLAPAHHVVDAGTLAQSGAVSTPPGAVRYIVHRGPDYLALWHHLQAAPAADGIILLAESGRALRPTDATEVTGLPIVAVVPVSATVARTIDAGLLLPRLTATPGLAPLLALAHAAGITLAAATA